MPVERKSIDIPYLLLLGTEPEHGDHGGAGLLFTNVTVKVYLFKYLFFYDLFIFESYLFFVSFVFLRANKVSFRSGTSMAITPISCARMIS